MKSAWIVAVLLFVVVVSGASAQLATGALSPRSAGMGGCGIAVCDDAVAWAQNPAGLAALKIKAEPGKTWANDAIGSYMKSSDFHVWGLDWSGWEPASKMGFGAGYANQNMGGGSSYGAGFGIGLKDTPLSFGVNVIHTSGNTGWDLGGLYKIRRSEAPSVRFGLLVEDITNQSNNGPWFDLAVAWPVDPKLLVAVDVLDVTNKTDNGPYFNAGAEYALADSWKVRAGIVDNGNGHDLTLGAGYAFSNNWRVDGAWINSSPDTTWSVGVGVGF